MSTRRNFRKDRPVLESGAIELKGKVVKFYPDKGWGYISPENGSAWIVFLFSDVPLDREKCVGVGRTVFFDVIQRGEVVRRNHRRPNLVAIVRSKKPS